MSERVGTLIPAGREVEGNVRLPMHALISLLIHGDVFVHTQTGTLTFTAYRGLNPSGHSLVLLLNNSDDRHFQNFFSFLLLL